MHAAVKAFDLVEDVDPAISTHGRRGPPQVTESSLPLGQNSISNPVHRQYIP